jgi:hypothetical protein
VLIHTFNPSTWEAEEGRLQVPGLPELHSNNLSQKNENKNKNKTKQKPFFTEKASQCFVYFPR